MVTIDGANIAGICAVFGALMLGLLSYRYREDRGETLAEQIARERQLNNES